MSIGLIIKQERIKQNIKQINLAKGICSISYLSKIENNLSSPNRVIIDLLLKRLNIKEIDCVLDEENVINSLYKVYKEGVLYRDEKYIRKRLEELTERHIRFSSNKNFCLFTAYKCRLKLISGININDLLPDIELFQSLKTQDGHKEVFQINLILGLFFYLNKEYTKALNYLKKGLKLIRISNIEDWEKADFYNIISLAYFENNSLSQAEYFADKALKFYHDNLILNRAIDSYILLGNIEKRLKNYNRAEEYFSLAKKISQDIKLPYYEAIILQNVGSIFSLKGDSNKALTHFEECIKLKKYCSDKSSYLLTVLSIVKELSKMQQRLRLLYWCKHGIDIIDNDKRRELEPYSYHFSLYQNIYAETSFNDNQIKEVIVYFEKTGDFRHVLKYSLLLAELFAKQNKYKCSVFYFQKAKINLFEQQLIKNWEDL
ncbi:tetratricopeptide (TPR) repeat protein [Sporosarcina luteola]|nr:tetratricopeptide (TPR) repeat protein [Sporosarcina luteola]